MKKVLELLELANVQGVQLDDQALSQVHGGEALVLTTIEFDPIEDPIKDPIEDIKL
jgi:hypothetical protein